MSKLPFFSAMLFLLFVFSSANAQSTSDPMHLPDKRETLSYDNLPEFTRLAVWGSGSVFDVAWINEENIAVASASGTWIYELGQPPIPTQLFSPPQQQVFASSNSNWVMTYSHNQRFDSFFDNSFTAWNLTGESRQLLTVSRVLGDPAFELSPVMHVYGRFGKYVVASQGPTTFVWPDDFSSDPLQFKQLPSNRTEYFIEQATLSSDGKYLATAARAIISDQLIISVWDTDNGEEHILYKDEYLPSERLILRELQFSENGYELAAHMGFVGQNRLEMRLNRWNVTTGQELNSISLPCEIDSSTIRTAHYVNYPANFFLCRFSGADGKSILQIRSLDTGLLRATIEDNSFEPNYAISPNSQYIALANATRYTMSGDEVTRYRIVVWDIERDRLFAEFEGSADAVTAMEFSPDGKQLLSGNYDGTVRIWDLSTKTQSHLIEPGHSLPITAVAFSPDDR